MEDKKDNTPYVEFNNILYELTPALEDEVIQEIESTGRKRTDIAEFEFQSLFENALVRVLERKQKNGSINTLKPR